MRNWNNYDASIKNEIELQKKFIQKKNYEMDSRASGIQNFGVQPSVPNILEKKRALDKVVLETTKDKEPEARLPAYKRKFTPITHYMKKLQDTRIQQSMFGG